MKRPSSWVTDQVTLDISSGDRFATEILHAGFPSCSICSTVSGVAPSKVGKFSFLQNWEKLSSDSPAAVIVAVRSTVSSL